MNFYLDKSNNLIKADIYDDRDLSKQLKGAYTAIVKKHDTVKEKFSNLLGGKKKKEKPKIIQESIYSSVEPKEPGKIEYVDDYGIKRFRILEVEPEPVDMGPTTEDKA